MASRILLVVAIATVVNGLSLDASSQQSPLNKKTSYGSTASNFISSKQAKQEMERTEEEVNKILKQKIRMDEKPKFLKTRVMKTETEVTVLEYPDHRSLTDQRNQVANPETGNIIKGMPEEKIVLNADSKGENSLNGNSGTKPTGTNENDVELQDVAKGKPTQQSSGWSPQFDAHFAVDGSIYTLQHTAAGDEFPWWRVDLLEQHDVKKVAVYARPRFERRFHDVAIIVSNEDIRTIPLNSVFDPGMKSICADNIGTETSVGPRKTTFECKQTVVGRYVSIQITADCKIGRRDCNMAEDHGNPQKKHLLQMNEVEVFGVAVPEPKNIAKGKPAKQSSSWIPDFGAIYATDENTYSMQHTAGGDQFPWWRVDLLKPYNVQTVSVYARPKFERRFHDVAIIVSNEDISTKTPNTVFNPNKDSICMDNIGSTKAVGPKWTTFECTQTVVGRYVSIQITADCKPGRRDCNVAGDYANWKSKQLLQMMEVKVIGEPVETA